MHSTWLQSNIYLRRNNTNPQVPCKALSPQKALQKLASLLWLLVQSPINSGRSSHPKFLLGTKKHLHLICSPSFFSGGAQPCCCGYQTPLNVVAVAESLFLWSREIPLPIWELHLHCRSDKPDNIQVPLDLTSFSKLWGKIGAPCHWLHTESQLLSKVPKLPVWS